MDDLGEENIDAPAFLKAGGEMAPKNAASDLERKPRTLKDNGDNGQDNNSEATKVRLRTELLKLDSKTILVKNLPKSVQPKVLTGIFKQFGDIECVRLRYAAPENPNKKKRKSVILQKFHPQTSNMCGFICFKSEESVENVLKAKNVEIDGHNVFIRQVGKSKKEFSKNAIFVGNLPFGAKEKGLYGIFNKCGKIVDITIIHSKRTGKPSGVAYVNFESSDGVELALQMGEVTYKERQLRISRSCLNKAKNKVKTQSEKKVKHKKVQGGKKANIDSSGKQKTTIKKVKHQEYQL